MGIDQDDFPHIFERFYRGQKVSQSKTMGSGLGLAIVKEIVDLHDGRIDWESESGRGPIGIAGPLLAHCHQLS